MVDITHKNNTLREATALAIVTTSSASTIQAIKNDAVPKGNVLEMSKAAGLLGIKNTPLILPDCHPLPIEAAKVNYELNEKQIKITVTVKTIYKTGVEVEAMHGASVVALNIYDMLKPIDKGVEIGGIRLLEKKGGKSSYQEKQLDLLTAQVVVCSDMVSKGLREDKGGEILKTKLEESGLKSVTKKIIPDEASEIEKTVTEAKNQHTDLLIFTGGTGLSVRDITPETIEPMLDRSIPGITEHIRNYGQERMPYALLSRSVAGHLGNMLVITLPGSSGGVRESWDALFPHVLHAFKVLKGHRHD